MQHHREGTEMFEDLLSGTHKLTSQISEFRKLMQNQIVQGVSGAGGVKVTMNGLHEVIKVEIESEFMDDKEVLEDLVAAALNDTNRRVMRNSAEFIEDSNLKLMDMFK